MNISMFFENRRKKRLQMYLNTLDEIKYLEAELESL